MKTCFICNKPAISQYINPPMCQRHHEFSVLCTVTSRTGYEITVGNLEINYERLRFTPCFSTDEIPALLQETAPVQSSFEFGGNLK